MFTHSSMSSHVMFISSHIISKLYLCHVIFKSCRACSSHITTIMPIHFVGSLEALVAEIYGFIISLGSPNYYCPGMVNNVSANWRSNQLDKIKSTTEHEWGANKVDPLFYRHYFGDKSWTAGVA